MDDYKNKLSDHIYRVGSDEQDLKVFRGGYPVSVDLGLEIYRKNLIFGFLQTLQGIFPATEVVLCVDNFKFFVREYIYKYPSTSHDLSNYGEEFPFFLSTRTEVSHWPWLRDLAALEWYWAKLGLSQPSSEVTGVRVHPGVILLEVGFDVLAFWKLFDEGAAPEHLTEPDQRPQYLIMWQSEDDQDCMEEISAEEFSLISTIRGRGPFGLDEKNNKTLLLELRRRGWVIG